MGPLRQEGPCSTGGHPMPGGRNAENAGVSQRGAWAALPAQQRRRLSEVES
jgi:hypothetical protein